MSPKKKPTPTKSAPKDDLINSLYESESAGSSALKNDPASENDDLIYNFDAEENAGHLSLVHDAELAGKSVEQTDDSPLLPPTANFSLETISVAGKKQPVAKAPPASSVTASFGKAPEHKPENKFENAPENKPVAPKTPPRPPAPPPAPQAKLQPVDPDPVERAPTEPVKSSPKNIVPPDLNRDEKTVAVDDRAQERFDKTPTPSMSGADRDHVNRDDERFMPTEIRPNSPAAQFRENVQKAQPGAAIFSSAEAALRQSENLRVAQNRISALESELERVRRENESLRSAGDTLRRRMDELQAHSENVELGAQETKKVAEEERKVLKGQIHSRDREIAEMKGRLEDAETRLESNFRKIRVRERDLEHRIEIIKAESQSITASKDRMILELKRQIDQISSELNHSKAQTHDIFNQFREKQDTARRAVRALRIALTVLEGEDDTKSNK